MWELEPPPIERLTEDMFRPFPARASFEGLLSEAAEQLRGHDVALTGAGVTVIDDPTAAVDARYLATVAGAAAHVDAEIASSPATPTSALIENGDNTDNIRRSVLRYLPGPDGPIRVTLNPPPVLPDAENPFPTPPPRGGDDIVGPT